MASRKSVVLESQVIALSARGLSGRNIARKLAIDRRTVARILAGPEAQRIASAILRSVGAADISPDVRAILD